MKRCILNVATGPYVKGQERLRRLVGDPILTWSDTMPTGSPTHQRMPYAFKAWAINHARSLGYTSILWADSSIVPDRPLAPLWELIESQGYWFSRNGWTNHDWTCAAAYPLLGVTEEENKSIPHVVATTFGLDLRQPIGQQFAGEYLRLAQNGSFRGPWTGGVGVQHRHDQTAASVIAHRLGMRLTDPPAWFAYRGGETDETVLVADGNY